VQQEPLDSERTVFDAVASGLADVIALIDDYTHGRGDLDTLQGRIERRTAGTGAAVDETLHRLHSGPEARIGTLSGGNRKRVALAQALVRRPTCCCWTNRPTTWTSIPSSGWRTCCSSSRQRRADHARPHLPGPRRHAHRRTRSRPLLSYPGNFTQYQALKQEQLAQEAVVNAKADKLLAQEEVWVRKGVEARRTRAQGRITRLSSCEQPRGAPRGPGQRQARRPPQAAERENRRRNSPKCPNLSATKTSFAPSPLPSCAATRSGPDRPNWCGQDDAAQADPGRARTGRRQDPPGRQPAGRLFRPDA
jgi:hypothetical protein